MHQLVLPLFATASLTLSLSAHAKEYLSFDLGSDTETTVEERLTDAGASYEPGYGYKGYSDLTMFKVHQYEGFSKYGTVDAAWLHFTPENILYKVSVTYRDAGDTYRMFSDALNSKYQKTANGGFGFDKSTSYQDGDIAITLKRNEFGFGSDQKTTLEYELQSALTEVQQMKALIDELLRQQNADKAGDL